MNADKLQIFLAAYQEGLQQAVGLYPAEYPWYRGEDARVVEVSAKMSKAIEGNSFNKDGRGFVYACKKLGIKHTYKAIDAFIER